MAIELFSRQIFRSATPINMGHIHKLREEKAYMQPYRETKLTGFNFKILIVNHLLLDCNEWIFLLSLEL